MKQKVNLKQEEVCEKCKKTLGMSQFARGLNSSGQAVRIDEDLVCRNWPHCEKAEKESRIYPS